MRFEKKYTSHSNIRSNFKVFISSCNFKKAFESRIITSIYYENQNFSSFLDSEEGNKDRHKLRIRFYNQNFLQAFIEKKIKNADLGSKKYFDVNEAIKNNGSLPITLQKNLLINIPKRIKNTYPILIIEYKRDYYLSKDKNTRITLDSNITFRNITNSKKIKLDLNVIEIKYPEQVDFNNMFLDKIIEQFNLNLLRFSKYCTGIKLFY